MTSSRMHTANFSSNIPAVAPAERSNDLDAKVRLRTDGQETFGGGEFRLGNGSGVPKLTRSTPNESR